MNPKISIIIPTYNEEKYIDTTLLHIKKQKPYEIIVADSYSKDKTAKIAKSFGAKIIYVKRKNAATGRNAGAKISKGNILLFLDADTIVFDNLLKIIKRDFRNKNIVGWTCPVYAFSNKIKDHIIYQAFDKFVEMSINTGRPHIAGVCIAIRKSVFDKIGGFNENINILEDIDLSRRLKNCGYVKISKSTCVFTSVRRIEKSGIMNLIKVYGKAYFNILMKKNRKFIYKPIR